MSRWNVDPNAKRALNDYKIEIANELGIHNEISNEKNNTNNNMTKKVARWTEGRLSKRRMD